MLRIPRLETVNLDGEHAALTRTQRTIAACTVAAVMGFGTYLHLVLRGPGIQASDFTYPWLAARAVLAGQDPYIAVPAAHPPWAPWFLYPIPAALIVVPIAWLPVRVAAGVFVGASSGLLAFFVTRRGWWPLLMFLSAPAVVLARSAQGWASLMTAASFFPPALAVCLGKPNLGLPMFVRQSSVRAWMVGGISCLALLGISLLVKPDWPLEWWRTVHDTPPYGGYKIPAFQPLGCIVWLALVRWRQPEARFLLAMSLCPQNAYFYDQMPLLLLPSSRIGLLCVAVISQLAAALAPAMTDDRYPYMLLGLYWPALLVVLASRRPNVA